MQATVHNATLTKGSGYLMGHASQIAQSAIMKIQPQIIVIHA